MTAVAWPPVRRHLRAVRRSHASRSLRDVLAQGYEWLLYLFVLGGLIVTALQSSVASLATPPAGAGSWLGAAALLAGAGAIASALRAFGPVVVGPAHASWLLPAPLDRAELIAVRVTGVVLGTAAVAAGVTGLVAAGAGASSPVAAGLAGGIGALGVAALCVLAQEGGPRADRVAGAAARTVLGAALLAAAILVLAVRSDVELPVLVVTSPALVVAVLAVPSLAACGWAWRYRGRTRAHDLTRGTPLLTALAAGSTALDPSITVGALAERRLLRHGTVRSGRHRPGRRRALLRASLRAAARNRPAVTTSLALVVLTHVAGVLVPPFAVPVVQLTAATTVAAGASAPLRAVAGFAALRRDLGGRDRELVALHCVVPIAAAVVFTLLVAPAGGTVVSLVLLPLSAIAVVARHATRPPPSTTMTLYESPVGIAVPIELVRDLSRGPALFTVLAAVQVITGG